MARLMLSAGMFSALAAAMAPRRRGLPSGSPPPVLAAMVISLMRRVKILPRLASVAPFLCLMVAHLEWPDMVTSTALEKAGDIANSLPVSRRKASIARRLGRLSGAWILALYQGTTLV